MRSRIGGCDWQSRCQCGVQHRHMSWFLAMPWGSIWRAVTCKTPWSKTVVRGEIGKAFDYSAPIGEIYPVASVAEIQQANISLAVNGEPKQQGNINQLIWNVAETIANLSEFWAANCGGVGGGLIGDLTWHASRGRRCVFLDQQIILSNFGINRRYHPAQIDGLGNIELLVDESKTSECKRWKRR